MKFPLSSSAWNIKVSFSKINVYLEAYLYLSKYGKHCLQEYWRKILFLPFFFFCLSPWAASTYFFQLHGVLVCIVSLKIWFWHLWFTHYICGGYGWVKKLVAQSHLQWTMSIYRGSRGIAEQLWGMLCLALHLWSKKRA